MPKPKIAVILLPGILGSPLEISNPDARITDYPNDAWPVDQLGLSSPVVTTTFFKMPLREKISRFVSLDSPTLELRTRVKEATVNQDGKTANVAPFYQDFISEAATGGKLKFGGSPYSVHVLNYDWTQPMKKILQVIVRGTDQIMRDAKADCLMYVTHSMGGLVAMEVIRENELWKDKKFVGAVRVACPVWGAPETLARMHIGIRTPWKEFASKAVAKMLGNEGWRFSLLAASVPGIALLLPPGAVNSFDKILAHHTATPVYRGGDSKERHDAWVLLNDFKDALTEKMRLSINLAIKTHQRVAARAEDIQSCVTAVAISGKKTLLSFNDAEFKDGKTLSNPKYGAGDGTVPYGYQTLFSSRVFEIREEVDHAEAFEAAGRPAIFHAINDRHQIWVKRDGS